MSKGTESRRIPLIGQLGDVDLRLLRIFRKVVECGGFSSAQVDLDISRPAISVAINDLETRLSMRLCQRGRSGFALTREGQQVYDYSLRLLAAVEEFRTRVNGVHESLTGELNIGIADNLVSMPQMQVSNALRRLKAQGDQVYINIHMKPPEEIEMAILAGSLHAGVVPGPRRLAGLDYTFLYSERSALYCGGDHPLFDRAAIELEEIVACDAVAPAYAQTAEIRRHYDDLWPMASASDREGVAFLILAGGWIGFLPTHYAERWVEQGRMRVLAPQHFGFDTHYYSVVGSGATPNLVLKRYLAELAALRE
ncbi:LysR family transcriptional regulator [Kushneria aurantia]|uniref:LysR family transcriptional regulator n=1 Tax=Kushneria aurantia TaxID=504092 RepID=A0ABV6G4P5_9GAMM|nr:LysR family transcriptional regulator [Kushneria aurantia]